MKNTHWAHLALFLVNVIYGANYIVAKNLMPDVIGPSGFILLRVSGASLLFGAILFLSKKEKIKREDIGRLVLCGILGVAVNQLFFFNGLHQTSPVNASVIMTVTPILVLAGSWFFLKEKITWKKSVGILIGASGAIVLIVSEGSGPVRLSTPTGDAMIFINAVSYALYLITVKPLMKKYNPINIISYTFFVGLLFTLPFGWEQISEVKWESLLPEEIWSLTFVVVGVTFLAYLLNIFSLKYLSPNVVSIYIYLQPLLAVVFGYFSFLFFPEQPNYNAEIGLLEIGCALAIFLGVYLVSFPEKKTVNSSRADNS